jgi:molybdenum cofactor guanylyltransferase
MGVTGIILAGGLSSRMGSEKALLISQGATLISHAINTLSPLCSDIIISTNNPGRFDSFPYRKITDTKGGRGPIAGIASALDISDSEINIILAVDMPAIKPEFLSSLLKLFPGTRAVVPVSGSGKTEPLCGIYSRSLLPDIKELIRSGNFAVNTIADIVGVKKIQVLPSTPGYSENMFLNLNNPSDLADWESVNRL